MSALPVLPSAPPLPAPLLSALSEGHGEAPPLVWVLPFAAMLLSIAVLPLVAGHWWHKNRNRLIVALICGLPVLGYFVYRGDWLTISHTLHEYASFVILLGALYTASGGIVLRGDLRATPAVNVTFLAIGSLLASFMGTTGAAMLLIRPLLRTNSERRYKVHTVVFFIFTVCNVGGCLTPLGDPPLFLGYLRGVPFTWTFGLWKEWAFVIGILLVLYYMLDSILYGQEPPAEHRRDEEQIEPLSLAGLHNFLWLAGVVVSVAFLTSKNLAAWLGTTEDALIPRFTRDAVLVLIGFLAYRSTRPELRERNEFTWEPILEVAALFLGIFLSMMAAIAILNARGGDLPLDTPHHFFWLTGSLSAFLDNAPTYVVFFEAARAKAAAAGATEALVAGVPVPNLIAISLGAVFMGAMTYIGNAPNFMVKAIAEERGVRMPSFFGYMLYSVAILVPVFFAATWIFL